MMHDFPELSHEDAPVRWDRPELVLVVGSPGSGKTTLLLALAEEAYRRGWWVHWIAWDPRIPAHATTYQDLDEWAVRIKDDPPTQRVALFIDEVDRYASSSGSVHPLFRGQRSLLRRHRHYGLTIIGATLRPYAISADWRSMVSVVIAMRLVGDRDLEWLRQTVPTTRREIEAIPRLKVGEYIWWRVR